MQNTHTFRVRYSEIDAMGTYYNARALEWFECGRTELCRASGVPYTQWEQRGVAMPLITAHVDFLGRAQYDDLLRATTTATMVGRARARFDVVIDNAETGRAVCRGYTIHAVTDNNARPIRPPQWILDIIQG